MPLEVFLLAPMMLSVDDQREFAELLNPPVVATEICGGGAVSFTELDGTAVLNLGRPRKVETQTDVRRILAAEGEADPDQIENIAYWYEAVIPFADFARGLTLLYAFEQALSGHVVVRGLNMEEVAS